MNVVARRRMANQKTSIEILYDVGCAPVQLCCDCGHERGQEACHDDSSQGMRNMIVYHEHVAGLRMLKAGIQNNCRKGRENPRPWTQRIVSDVEPQHRE